MDRLHGLHHPELVLGSSATTEHGSQRTDSYTEAAPSGNSLGLWVWLPPVLSHCPGPSSQRPAWGQLRERLLSYRPRPGVWNPAHLMPLASREWTAHRRAGMPHLQGGGRVSFLTQSGRESQNWREAQPWGVWCRLLRATASISVPGKCCAFCVVPGGPLLGNTTQTGLAHMQLLHLKMRISMVFGVEWDIHQLPGPLQFPPGAQGG